MARLRYIVREDVYAMQKPGGIFGIWTIKKGDLEQTTEYAYYVSLDRAKKLKSDLKLMVGDVAPKEADVIDLLDEINDEPHYNKIGGVVVYFMQQGDKKEVYSFEYIGKVGRVKIAHQ